jgi:hypothetical protein
VEEEEDEEDDELLYMPISVNTHITREGNYSKAIFEYKIKE